jgi:hypothetical protein
MPQRDLQDSFLLKKTASPTANWGTCCFYLRGNTVYYRGSVPTAKIHEEGVGIGQSMLGDLYCHLYDRGAITNHFFDFRVVSILVYYFGGALVGNLRPYERRSQIEAF